MTETKTVVLFWHWTYGALYFEECDSIEDAASTAVAMEDECSPEGAEVFEGGERRWLPYFRDKRLNRADNDFTAAIRRIEEEQTAAWRREERTVVGSVLIAAPPGSRADATDRTRIVVCEPDTLEGKRAKWAAIVGADRVRVERGHP